MELPVKPTLLDDNREWLWENICARCWKEKAERITTKDIISALSLSRELLVKTDTLE